MFANYDEHAKIVAERCAKQFSSRTEIERYLSSIGWDWETIERMMRYLDRKREKANEQTAAEIDLPDSVPDMTVKAPELPKVEIPEDWDI